MFQLPWYALAGSEKERNEEVRPWVSLVFFLSFSINMHAFVLGNQPSFEKERSAVLGRVFPTMEASDDSVWS